MDCIIMKESTLKINNTQITSPDLTFSTVMHKWETPIMKEKAKWVCQNGGDILEVGFGMGISANYIQKQKINSHTICEIHPQILEILHKWAEDKPNVIILEGDWYDNVNKMSKYNGILFDTHNDPHVKQFRDIAPEIAKPNCNITWWNNLSEKKNFHRLEKTTFDILNVNPVSNSYFNHKHYYMPKCTYNA